MMGIFEDDEGLACADVIFEHPLCLEIIVGQVKFIQLLLEPLRRKARIHEGAEDHVPAGA